uniref:Uncharacterized protein n=1 Tax=Parascaris univalens TaxID=6257 RepID=A0A915CEN0_PARUN
MTGDGFEGSTRVHATNCCCSVCGIASFRLEVNVVVALVSDGSFIHTIDSSITSAKQPAALVAF